MTNPKSAIAKGKRLTNFINQEIENYGFGKAISTPGSGCGKLKGDSWNNLPFLLEFKNSQTIHFLQDVDQAIRQAEIGNWAKEKWALILRDPRFPEFERLYATIDFYQFLDLLKRYAEPKIKEPDREMKYLMERVLKDAKEIIKRLEY